MRVGIRQGGIKLLNADYKKQVIEDLQKIDEEYVKVFKKAVSSMERLQNTRNISVRTIQYVERYIITLANRPRNFDTKIGEIKVRYIKYLDAIKEIQELEREKQQEQIKSNYAIAGTLSGIGVATLGPTAAMSVAMTFGTASTGTAIASLSGAAATNAALAWLGGGAVAAGGAGMIGGQALVNLAGPVGWAISGASILASLMAVNLSNKEVAKKTEESISAIKKEMERIREIDKQVNTWNDETKQLTNKVSKQLNLLKTNRKRDYKAFNDREIEELTILFNSTEVLSTLLGKTIEGR